MNLLWERSKDQVELGEGDETNQNQQVEYGGKPKADCGTCQTEDGQVVGE